MCHTLALLCFCVHYLVPLILMFLFPYHFDWFAGVIRVGDVRLKLPRAMSHLSSESLSSDGAFLLYDGVETMLWLGRAVPPGLLEALFGTPSIDGVDPA